MNQGKPPQDRSQASTDLDSLVDQFKADWREGRSPQLEAVWESAGHSASEVLFRELMLAELEARATRDTTQSVVDYLERFRELPFSEDTIRSTFAEWEATAYTKKLDGDSQVIPRPQCSLPEQLDRYEIRETLGKGGFGTVYRAWDPRLQREVALKVPHAHLLQTPEIRERYLREARAMSALRHPGICPVYDVHEFDDGTLLLSLAFIEGEALSEYIRREAPIDERQAATIVIQIGTAVDHAHRKGILHRDLKPQNILMNEGQESPVVTDFGLARRNESGDATLTQEGELLGTPAYMSPEQASGDAESLGPRSDIYSLGIILYEMLAGQRPYSGSTAQVLSKVLNEEPSPIRSLRPSVSPAMEAVCRRAMSKEPANRFQSMALFCRALESSMHGQLATPNVAPTASDSTPPERHSWSRWLWAAGAVLAIILGAAGALNSFLGDHDPRSAEPETHAGAPASPSKSAATSPFVGRWRLFSRNLPATGGLIEFSDTGEATLWLPESGAGATGSVRLPSPSSLRAVDSVQMTWEAVSTEAATPQTRFGFELGPATLATLNWKVEIESGDKHFPTTDLNLYSHESWSLTMADSDHCVGLRNRTSSDGAKDMKINHDWITLIREDVAVGLPLPINHWLSNDVRYWERKNAGRVACLFTPDCRLFLAPSKNEIFGGRQGLGGVELTYRVLEVSEQSIQLELRSVPTKDRSQLASLWKSIRLGPKEVWTCVLQDAKSRSGDVQVERQFHVVEVRERLKSYVEEVDGKPVTKTKAETIGVEVPVTMSFSLSSVNRDP